MTNPLSLALLLVGAFFMFVAGLGLVRMPDIYMRLSATTKAVTFGVGFELVAAISHFKETEVSARAIATLAFLFLTAPVAAHMIGRAAYVNGVPLWSKSVVDELKGLYKARAGGAAPSGPSEGVGR